MYTFNRTEEFDDWLRGLADLVGRAKILARIRRAESGNFGDCEPVGDGVSEMRIDYGPGYRAYFAQEGCVVYLLLCGGNKSTQKTDIRRAKALWNACKGA
ncbi:MULTISPECIES: type II toxin-antitoxin system RelE/ParE family toxin [unclassified Paraburkholderia]|uniref:type II toxin-antitoxin system RelE/ParE family toxin n=1 Tax=unclassified Paraburkholderia TaxID=2615204 RepID=UPI002AB167E8|nr:MULTISPECIES: type II toxin-antitoxin system RelE/ParE family toxin [unclassified Paraburkholderia]